jgi:uncharacterized membrane protein YccC
MAAVLRTLADIEAQARLDALADPPLSQAQADRVAAILAPCRRKRAREPQAA